MVLHKPPQATLKFVEIWGASHVQECRLNQSMPQTLVPEPVTAHPQKNYHVKYPDQQNRLICVPLYSNISKYLQTFHNRRDQVFDVSAICFHIV